LPGEDFFIVNGEHEKQVVHIVYDTMQDGYGAPLRSIHTLSQDACDFGALFFFSPRCFFAARHTSQRREERMKSPAKKPSEEE